MRGGARPGAGRPKGSKTVDANKMLRRAKHQGVDVAGTSLAYLQGVYTGKIKNPDPRKIEAARAAAPYEFPRLTDATVTQKGEMDGLSQNELDQKLMASLVHMAGDKDWRPKLIQWAKEHLGLVDRAPRENVISLRAPLD